MLQAIYSLPIWALITIPVSVYILYIVTLAIIDPLRHIPGPFLARFSRAWYCWEIYKGHFERTNHQLHTRYGPIVRIAPHEYSIDDVDAAKVIYSIGGGNFPKAPWYWAWQPLNTDTDRLFSELDPHRHSASRRKVANYYSMSSMVGYECYVDNCTESLSRHFVESAISGDLIDMQHWLQCYAFDVIGEITFGQSFGFLDKGEDQDGVFKAIDAAGSYSTFVGIWSWIHAWIFPLLPATGGIAYTVKFTMDRIVEKENLLKERRCGDKEKEGAADFVTRILSASEKDPAKITRNDLAATYEIEIAAKEGRISDPITFKEAQGLPYLQAVIKEGLRVHPAVGLGLQRIVPAGGTTIANQFIPGGSTVGINAYVAHKNTSVWGSDADQWRPERWLEIAEQGRGGEVEKYFFSFGMGSRTCIGKNISLLELSKLIPQLVRRFDFELDADVERTGGLYSLNRWFVKQQNFRARVLRRGKDGGME
ncbi:cytochrome p450 pisatin [Botrytis cinerea]